MDAYRLAMLTHIIGSILLFSGLVLTTAALLAMARADSVPRIRRWAVIARRVDKLLASGAGLLLLSGIYLALTAWGWRVAWINASLAALLVMSPLVPIGISMRLPRIASEASGTSGAPALPELRALTWDPILWVSTLVVACTSFGILYLMLAKPGSS